ncbi:MAG: hypothetical protein AAGI70_16060, partial [Pseudomonadota bacterium]
MKRLFLVAALLSFTPVLAQAVTIDFGGAPNGAIAPGNSYVEDGFRFQTISGDQWVIDAVGFGNPVPGFLAGFANPVGIGDVFSITRVDGGLFTLDGFDFATIRIAFRSVGVDIRVIRDGVVVEDV